MPNSETLSVKDRIRQFLTEDTFYSGSIPKDFADDFLLIDSGALDSLGIFNLIVFLETTFNIQIETEDLSSASFGTLKILESFVQSKIGSHGQLK